MDDGSQKLITKSELHVVVVRPKAYVSSTGTSWANETHRLRCEYPDVHEVPVSGDQSVSYSANFRRFCATVQCDIFMLNDMTMMEDLQKMKLQGPCIHQSYELKRLEHFLHRKEIAFAEVDLKMAVLCEGEGTLVDEIKRYLTPLTTHCSKLAEIIKEARRPELSSYEELQTQAQEVLTFLESLRLPQVKPRWAEFTDAGPGVSINNGDVKVRSAELDRMYNRDFRIRVHRSRGDSGQNEAERTNSAIGDAVVDGATIEWEHYERFDGLQDNEIAAMSLQDYEIHEAQRMEKNAWRVANQLAERIDGAPVLSEFIHGCVSEKTEDSFFFNEDYLSKYMSATKNVRSHLPGSAYFNKISDFMDTHVQSGELYSEFLRDSCQKTDGSLCQYCSENRWVGPVMTRIPRPIPDYSKLTDYSYKSVRDTSVLDSDGKERKPDDWQPRHNIRKQYEQKNLSADDVDGVKEFSKKFVVEEKYVKSYLDHLTSLENLKKIRDRQRQNDRRERQQKDVSSYNWKSLVEDGKLASLTVPELDKYLEHYQLPKNGRKNDKMRRIIAHYFSENGEQIPENFAINREDDNESESGSDEDLLIYESESSDNVTSESEDSATDSICNPPSLVSRSGRRVGHWRTRYAN